MKGFLSRPVWNQLLSPLLSRRLAAACCLFRAPGMNGIAAGPQPGFLLFARIVHAAASNASSDRTLVLLFGANLQNATFVLHGMRAILFLCRLAGDQSGNYRGEA